MRRKSYRVLLSLFLVCALLCSSAGYSSLQASSDEIKVYVDGQRISFDVPPMIINGRTMVPLRAIFEAMGAVVTWDGATQTATGVKGSTTVMLTIGSLSPTINGVVVPLDVPARIVNSRTLAPLRFVGEAFGGSVSWDGTTRTVNISTTGAATQISLPKTPIDYSVSSSDLVCGESGSMSKGYVRPGIKLQLRAKVYKNTPGISGGGKVKFLLDGTVVDSVPFFFNAAEQYTFIQVYYLLPVDKYLSLAEGQQVSLRCEAQVEADALSSDTNASNNHAQINTFVQGIELISNDAPASPNIVSLEASSDIGSGVAKPGDSLNLKVRLQGSGGYTSVRFYVNNSLVDEKQCSVPKSGAETVSSIYYYVPWEYTGTLNCRVELENGEEASLAVPVEPYDFVIRSQDISWEYSSGGKLIPGRKVGITAKIQRNHRTSFTHTVDPMRVVFVVNGVPSEPIKITLPSGSVPYMGSAYYGYTVPEGNNGPLNVKVMVDAAGLFGETNEGNNLAQTSIPVQASGGSGPDLSITAADLWYAPNPIVPGEKVQLMAAIHNNAADNAPSSKEVAFTVNGQRLDSNNPNVSATIRGGQYYVTYKMWTAPDNLTSDPVFTVTIDPGHKLTGDNPNDNQATIVLPLARPDLAVETSGIGTSTDYILSGREAELTAAIYNRGPVAVSEAVVNFIVNGAVIGSKIVNLPAYGSVKTSFMYSVPSMTGNTAAGTGITGVTGYTSPQAGAGTINFSVKVDPNNGIQESNENNNTAGPVPLNVTIPSAQGIVYVSVKDSGSNNVGGAAAVITAGGQQGTAVTDQTGYCSFYNVPFGAYEVVVNKNGYNEGRSYDEYLYDGNKYDYAHVYLDNKAQLTGRVTKSGGSGLAGVSVQAEGSSYASYKTTTDSSGNYTLKLPAGSYTVKYRKIGYAKANENINLSTASSLTKNITMNTTNKAYVYGTVYDQNGDPMSGMTVDAVNVSKTVLVSTTTGADGNYYLEVPLTSASMDAGIQVSGRGLYAIQGVFLDQGLEDRCDMSFEPAPETTGEILSSVKSKVSPWVECASMPGTMFNSDYEVKAIYGMFELDTYIMATDSVITHLEIDTDPDYWLYSSVSSSWSPADLLEVDEITEAVIDVASMILPLDIPIAVSMHSTNHTKVWIKKIVIVSDGVELDDPVYPDTIGDYAYSPNQAVNWNNCRIKYYLKVDPDNGVTNPAAGYNRDRVLIEWDPKTKKFTKIGNYVVTGIDENTAREIYMDE